MPSAIPPSTAVHPRDSYRGSNNFRVGRSGQERRPAARFEGSRVDYRSGESVSLEVKTEDGDTVRISFEALNRIQAGTYAARTDGGTAKAESASAESSVSVEVSV